MIVTGKCSWFGGVNDHGVAPNEGLALFGPEDVKNFPELFLAVQPPGTTGVARRLNEAAYYCAMRWDYKQTSREFLRSHKVTVTNNKGESVFVQPVDWGPNIKTGRVIDLSPAALKALGLQTDDTVRVTVPEADGVKLPPQPMVVIKTGMSSEYNVAKAYAAPGNIVLTGKQTIETLDKLVPLSATGLISFGLCGGLSPNTKIGQGFIYSGVKTPTSAIPADSAWRKRLFAATKYYETQCWSSGDFNTANTIEQRAKLFAKTSCEVIDDESFMVAEFALLRNIPFAGLRVVSDGALDNLPQAVINALNADGSYNFWAVAASVAKNPLQIPALVKTAQDYYFSLQELKRAAITVGANFQAPV